MKKFKDLIYDYNDILLAIIIIIVAAAVIFWKVADVMAYPSLIRNSQKHSGTTEITEISNLDLTQEEVDPIAETDPAPEDDLTQTPYVGIDQDFEIKSGEYLSTVATNLLNQGLIQDKNEFVKTVESMGLASKVQIGKFTIPAGSSYEQIAKIITKTN